MPDYTIDTLLFDLDDTLIVERKSAEDSFAETVALIDPGIDRAEFVRTIFAQAKEQWYKLPTIDYCLRIGISSWEGLWADFTGDDPQMGELRALAPRYRFEAWSQALAKYGIDDPGIAEKASSDFKRIHSGKHMLFPETRETLEALKRTHKLGLITNGAPDLQWKKIDGGNLRGYFGCIAISGEHGYAKPDGRLFDIVLNGLKSAKQSTIMVGDSPNTDIKGAQDYGLKTIWVNRNNNTIADIRPDYVISNLSEIQGIIGLLNSQNEVLCVDSKSYR